MTPDSGERTIPVPLKESLASFPQEPGVYLMKDADSHVIYVGKAKDLKKRVSNYFTKASGDRYQIRFLMKRVVMIDFIVTANEKEALILENTLIKKYHPRYNIDLKDDKSYVSLKLTIHEKFPRIFVTRKIRKDGSVYFGPYSSAGNLRKTVDEIEKYFRLRSCSNEEFRNRTRPCLQHQIHRCDAPCVGYIDEGEYGLLVGQVRLFLKGQNHDLAKILRERMKNEAEGEEFEKAAITRDILCSIAKTLEKQQAEKHNWMDQDVIHFYREEAETTFCVLKIREGKLSDSCCFHVKAYESDEDLSASFIGQYYQGAFFLPDEVIVPFVFESMDSLQDILLEQKAKKVVFVVPKKGDRRDLLWLARKNAEEGFRKRRKTGEDMHGTLQLLRKKLHLTRFPRRMECYDISNIQGVDSVASMVCFLEGIPCSSEYRRFKIKTVEGANDFESMKEVLSRRLKRMVSGEKKWGKPDLIVIDGGKGQLNQVLAVFRDLDIQDVDLVALAKQKDGEDQDKVFLPDRKNPVLLGKQAKALHLLMHIRDEAHRFALRYHRTLRKKHALSLS